MSTYKQLQKQFDKDVKELQEKCKHKKSKWYWNMWRIGSFDGEVKKCLRCNKTLATRNTMEQTWSATSSSSTNDPNIRITN